MYITHVLCVRACNKSMITRFSPKIFSLIFVFTQHFLVFYSDPTSSCARYVACTTVLFDISTLCSSGTCLLDLNQGQSVT